MPIKDPEIAPNTRSELGQLVVSRLLAYADHPPYGEKQQKALSSAFQDFADQQFILHMNTRPNGRNPKK